MIVEYIRKGQPGKRKTPDMPEEECKHYVEVLKEHLKEDLIKVEIKEK